jgi:HSP20 family protein
MNYLSPFRKRARDLSAEMWDSFSDFFNENFFEPVRSDAHLLRTDIRDDGDQYVIEAELPGFDKNQIKVEYDRNYLTISAHREADIKEEKENYIRQERHMGEFVRRFYVKDIDENAIDATFNNGILTIRCTKTNIPKIEQKQIPIH